jgi:hypothetical protein
VVDPGSLCICLKQGKGRGEDYDVATYIYLNGRQGLIGTIGRGWVEVVQGKKWWIRGGCAVVQVPSWGLEMSAAV